MTMSEAEGYNTSHSWVQVRATQPAAVKCRANFPTSVQLYFPVLLYDLQIYRLYRMVNAEPSADERVQDDTQST